MNFPAKASLGLFLALAGILVQGQNLSCQNPEGDIYSFTVEADSPLGRVNSMYIQHDSARGIPLTSTTLFNSLNHYQAVSRKDNFRKHECPSLQDAQTDCSVSYKTTPEQQAVLNRSSVDRGHMIPSNPMRFSAEANNHTFYCVNIAPQDPYTNQNPWVVLENQTLFYFKEKPGFVMVGLCDEDDFYSPTRDGYAIPECYWRMSCYKDAQGQTQVVGFVGPNTILNFNNLEGRKERDGLTLTPRSQQDVLALMPKYADFIAKAWQGAETYLLKNRNETGAPSALECDQARTISTEVYNEWASIMGRAMANHVPVYSIDDA